MNNDYNNSNNMRKFHNKVKLYSFCILTRDL